MAPTQPAHPSTAASATADTSEPPIAAALEFVTLAENRPPGRLRKGTDSLPTWPANQPALIALHVHDEPEVSTVDARITRFANGLVRAILEVLQGRRPATQLTRWLSDVALAELLRRVRQRRREHSWSVRSVRVQQPGPHGAEITFRIGHERRDAALAMRLDQLAGRWVCSVLDFGPGPFLP